MQDKPIEEIYELSPMQQGMLFHALYDPDSAVYFEQLVCTLQGALDVSALQQAWQQVTERHAVLRSSFHWEELDEPLQVVHRQVELPWVEYDWRGWSPPEQTEGLESWLEADRAQPFDLGQAPLMRFALIQVAEQRHEWVWSHHHLLFDGWSMPTILDEVLRLYEACHRGETLQLRAPRPYRDYIAWLRQQDREQAKVFWQARLQGVVAPTHLKSDQAIDAHDTAKASYTEQPLTLSVAVTEKLQALARLHHLTLNNVVQGVWALLLARYSNEWEVIFGATVSGRPATLFGVESMVGLFINTLPVRIHVAGDTELITWLKALQAQQVEQEPYAYMSLADIQQMSDVPAGIPLFESLLVFENYPFDASRQKRDDRIEISHLRSIERTNYPLTLVVKPEAELSGRFICDIGCFEAAAMRRMSGHFETLLERIAAYPGQRLGEFSLLTAAEREQILCEWNRTQTDYPTDRCIHELLESQAERTPNAVAVVFDQDQLTYKQWNRRANQLAHYLRGLGVGPDALVGICIERSIDMVVGLLGILKAGGAYVPLDPAYPKQRLAFMLMDAQVSVLLTQTHLSDGLPAEAIHIVYVDRDWPALAQYPQDNLDPGATHAHLAYVIYTSGSTGQPKGVLISHGSLLNLVFWHHRAFVITPEDRTTQLASLAFDAAGWEIWPSLMAGATLYLVPPDLLGAPMLLRDWLVAQSISVSFAPTPVAEQLITLEWPQNTALRLLLTGGDVLHQSPRTSLPFALINNYGPTDNTVVTTSMEMTPDRPGAPSIGHPIDNVQVYIRDRCDHLTPVGVPGELCIGGAGLALGYHKRPDLTVAKFVDNPYGGGLLYRSGDLARYRQDGSIEFLGRIDDQVKLRGFRIELGEIEAVLSQHPDVHETVAIVGEDTPGHKTLMAYVVPHQKPPIPSELRDFLKTKLPDYMIPAIFMPLETLPMTPNGKVDRRALPAPYASQREHEAGFVPPRTPTEEVIAAIWAEVLGIEKIGIHDHFFALGGHSLLATQVLSRLQEAFSLQLPLRRVFDRPTIAALAELVMAQQLEQAESDALEQILGEIETLSDDDVQQQLLL